MVNEAIGNVGLGRYPSDLEGILGNAIADEKVSHVHMLGPTVIDGVPGEIDGALVVAEDGEARRWVSEDLGNDVLK